MYVFLTLLLLAACGPDAGPCKVECVHEYNLVCEPCQHREHHHPKQWQHCHMEEKVNCG